MQNVTGAASEATTNCNPVPVCVFITAVPNKAVRVGGGGKGRTCATRDNEPRPVWTSLPITHW